MFFFQISCWQNVWTVTNFWSSSPLKRVPLIFCVCHQIVTQPQPQLNSKHRITQTKHFSLCNQLIIFDTFPPTIHHGIDSYHCIFHLSLKPSLLHRFFLFSFAIFSFSSASFFFFRRFLKAVRTLMATMVFVQVSMPEISTFTTV